MRKDSFCKIIFVNIISLILICTVYGQKPYHFNISFSGDKFNHSKLELNFYEGYEVRSIPITSSRKMIVEQSSRLSFPVLEFFYYPSHAKPVTFRLYVLKQNSKIEFYYDSVSGGLEILKSTGLLNFENAGQKKFQDFAKAEIQNIDSLSKRYNYHFSTDSAITQFGIETKLLREKSLDFIKDNPSSLYSLWLFTSKIIGYPDYSLEFQKPFYFKYLEPRYKTTFENTYVQERMDAQRLALHVSAPHSDLPFQDLNGKTYSINSFAGKPLIITLWATWCGPCIAELPQLKQLYSLYKANLNFVSFSSDENESKLKNYISANNLNWINVFGRNDLCNIYGADKGLPQVFLLDKNGVIIYSRTAQKDISLAQLDSMLQEMFK